MINQFDSALASCRYVFVLQSAMESMNLGPNGGLLYCMDYLLDHFDWLEEQIEAKVAQNISDNSPAAVCYVIFDCPGQVQLSL